MFKVKIISVGRSREAWLKEALCEYEKRIQHRMQLQWIVFESDKQLLAEKLEEPFLIALDRSGSALDSEMLSRKLFSEWGSRPSFVIGGPEGLAPSILAKAHFRWSLSPLTFTHQMVRLVLVEQLYRALEIERGSSYHK